MEDGTPLPKNWRYLSATVDAAGFMLPYELTIRSRAAGDEPRPLSEIVNRYASSAVSELRYRFYGAGELDPSLLADYLACAERIGAAAFPPIPPWLGEDPPYYTVFLPDGRIMTYGELGLRYDPDPDQDEWQQRMWWPPNEYWYIYSAEGQLFDRQLCRQAWSPNSWRDALKPGLAEQIEDERRRLAELNPDGTVSGFSAFDFTALVYREVEHPELEMYLPGSERAPSTVLAAWDWRGEPVGPESAVATQGRYCSPLAREHLSQYYRSQVEQGLVDPDVPSPYAGRADGPQIVDPAPRPRPVIAYTGSRLDAEIIRVRPPDDPENPYAGQYDDWDLWLYQNAGRENLEQASQWSEQMNERRGQIAALVKAGEEVPEKLLAPPFMPDDPEDPWQRFQVEVTPEGWPLPMRVLWERTSARRYAQVDLRGERFLPRPPRGPEFSAGGVIPAELQAQMDSAKRRSLNAQLPALPDWLAANPPAALVLLPNGEIVTMGPLGGYDAEQPYRRIKDLPEEQRGWFRYSAEGKLLDQYMHAGYDWVRLYHDEHEFIKTNAEASGLVCSEPLGFLIVRDGEDGPIRSIYDYDGTQLNVDQPLYRNADLCTVKYWANVRP